MNSTVDNYFVEGCGRCSLGGTPECKVHKWIAELTYLRSLMLECGLTEACKWGVPCYTFNGKNVLIVTAFKDFVSVSFFKGSILPDPENRLERPGQNSHIARLVRFTDLNQIVDNKKYLSTLIREAVNIEESGRKPTSPPPPSDLPKELEMAFEQDPGLRIAFESLTPGRKRGYLIHFSQARQAETRISRIKKCTPMILNGLGLHDQYQSRKK